MREICQQTAIQQRETVNAMTVIFGSRLTAADFLRKHWQKKPCLFRGAFPGFQDPLSPDELASVAMQDGVHARLIREREGRKKWTLKKGPFAEKVLRTLPDREWTLLVSKLEHWSDDAARLLDHFPFIPHWRCDDLMASFAPVGGTVGPHVDSYDVFLIQGMGTRRWQIAETFDQTLIGDIPIKVLQHFSPEKEWVLEPGDMLYLPPGVAHYGVALENCMTYSVGFRAPSERMLAGNLLNISDSLLSASKATDRLYADPDLKLQDCPGEISPDAVRKVRKLLEPVLSDPELFARWFGTYLSFPDPGSAAAPAKISPARIESGLEKGRTLVRSDSIRFFYTPCGDGFAVFAAGQEFLAGKDALPLLRLLSAGRYTDGRMVKKARPKPKPGAESLLHWLFATGAVYFD
jgi:50S ribosomal protein L16 3-hydroxylase